MDLEELKEALDKGWINHLEYNFRLNMERKNLLQEVMQRQRRCMGLERKLRHLELRVHEAKMDLERELRDLDRLEAVSI